MKSLIVLITFYFKRCFEVRFGAWFLIKTQALGLKQGDPGKASGIRRVAGYWFAGSWRGVEPCMTMCCTKGVLYGTA